MADLAAVACSNAEAYERARAAAQTDSLTGLLNHGALPVRLREEIWRSQPLGAPAVLPALSTSTTSSPSTTSRATSLATACWSGWPPAWRPGSTPTTGFRTHGRRDPARGGPPRCRRDSGGGGRRAPAHGGCRGQRRRGRGRAVGLGRHGALGRAAGRRRAARPRADRALLLAKRLGRDRVVLASGEVERELAGFETAGSGPSELMAVLGAGHRSFDQPSDLLESLPGLLRPALEMEEVADAAEPPRNGDPAALRGLWRINASEGGPPSLSDPPVTLDDAMQQRLDSGAVSRGSLPALLRALSTRPAARRCRRAPAPTPRSRSPSAARCARCSCCARDAARFPLPALRLAEAIGGPCMTVLLGANRHRLARSGDHAGRRHRRARRLPAAHWAGRWWSSPARWHGCWSCPRARSTACATAPSCTEASARWTIQNEILRRARSARPRGVGGPCAPTR